MKMTAFAATATLALCVCQHAAAQPAGPSCIPAGYDRSHLETLKGADFALPDGERDAFALAIAACLADPDPFLRDEIAYGALTHLLRSGLLSDAARETLLNRLWLQLATPDAAGFAQPFAALVLSEIVRSDRLAPFMAERTRNTLAADAARYVANVRDYRGFDEGEGWRHGVAHGADLLMQLARHEHISRPTLDRLLDAVAAQAAAHDGHFYIYGERLARVVLTVAHRGVYDEAFWTAWFAQVAAPAPLAAWEEAFASQAGLAKRHNTMAFLTFIYVNARLGGSDYAALLPGVEAALRQMP